MEDDLLAPEAERALHFAADLSGGRRPEYERVQRDQVQLRSAILGDDAQAGCQKGTMHTFGHLM